VKPITYALQFRGQVARLGEDLRKQARAPGGALVTSLSADGPSGRFVWAAKDEEALLESRLEFKAERCFEEEGTIVFAPGNIMRIRGRGRLAPSADPDLRQGTVVWRIEFGAGHLEGASGLITSNLLLSATGDLTENQLGVIFAPAMAEHPPLRLSSEETPQPP
jgi:hypothetical protein